MNRYMYVDGNPVSYRDPSGHVSGSGLMHMVNRIIGHAIGKDFNSNGLDKRLSTSGISKGVNRFVHNATFIPKGRYYLNAGKFWDNAIGKKGIIHWIKQQVDPTIKANNNATSAAQDNFGSQPVVYEEDWIRRQVKIYWVNEICNKQSPLACDLIQAWALKDYEDKAQRWNKKLVNDVQVGITFKGPTVDGRWEYEGYYHDSSKDTQSYSDTK
nr:hypothetical protein [Leptospira alexanderi]